MPPADTPDFDSMSPEEVMAWMESLAKRQGADSEGFTTDANTEIAEIDPDSVEIDEPGYVPFGEETKAAQEPEAPAPVAEPVPEAQPPVAEAVPEPPTPEPEPEASDIAWLETTPEPEAETPEPEAGGMAWLETTPEPEAEAPEPEAGGMAWLETTPEPEAEAPEPEAGGMAWLESLAADQDGGFPEMDLAALSEAIEDTEAEPEPANPMDWLESLAENQGEIDTPAIEAEAAQPESSAEPAADLSAVEDPLAAGIDPMLWLESLAKRQGANEDELLTSADMDITTPENAEETGPGYTDFSVEGVAKAAPEPEETTDPSAWLESMAVSTEAQPPDETAMSDTDIESALSRGDDISSDQMEQFFSRQLDRGLSREDVPPEPDETFDPDAPAIPAELPSWLIEQAQEAEETEETEETEEIVAEPDSKARQPALVDEIMEPPSQDLPDWLQEDAPSTDDLSLESIFESTDTDTDSAEVEYDSDDPWVQAFEEEATTDPGEVPEWYERNLGDPERIAEVERQTGQADEESLEAASLPPETGLPAGEPEAVPAWLSDEPAAEPAADMPDWLTEAGSEADTDTADIPGWLADAEVDVSPEEIPDWLRDTVETDEAEEEAIVIPAAEADVIETPAPAEPVPQPVAPAPVVAPVTPAVAPVPPVADAEVAATLERARASASSGDVDSSLQDYESMVRANAALDQVVSDLTTLVGQHQGNPAVYRVLGDSLMRQGNLQAALDTYRKALNQL